MVTSDASTPRLCAKGCGFFGTPAMNNLCLKCYKDHLKQEAAKHPLETHLKDQTNNPTGNFVGIPSTNPFPCFNGAAAKKATEVVTIAPEKNTLTATSYRCKICKRKVRLSGFGCRCGGLFCMQHRHPEAHACNKLSEYKEKGRAQLAKQNPLIVADKLENRA